MFRVGLSTLEYLVKCDHTIAYNGVVWIIFCLPGKIYSWLIIN